MVDLKKLIVKFGLDKRPAMSIERQKQIIAHNFINNSIQKGKIKRPNICHICLVKCKANAHHPNYNKPNLVWWLCVSCHLDLHR